MKFKFEINLLIKKRKVFFKEKPPRVLGWGE